jgi:hypothetical protein
MRVLVDDSGALKSAHETVDFNISGLHVLEIPTFLNVDLPGTATETSTIALKLQKFRDQHPSLSNYYYEDFLFPSLPAIPPTVDLAASTGLILGKNKQTSILPGGILQTTSMAMAAMTGNILVNLIGFYKFTDFGPIATIVSTPQKLLYNHDGTSFVSFNPADIQIEYSIPAIPPGAFTVISPDATISNPSFSGGTVVLKFTNISLNVVYMMDWTLLYDG